MQVRRANIFCLPRGVRAIPSPLFMAEMILTPEPTSATTEWNDASNAATKPRPFAWTDRFVNRHIGPSATEVQEMLKVVGYASLDALVEATVPKSIRMAQPLNLPAARSEYGLLNEMREL